MLRFNIRRVINAVLLFLTFVCAQGVVFQRCNFKRAETIKEIRVSGCDLPPCILKRGSVTPLEVHFTSNVNSEHVNADIRAEIIFGVLVPWIGHDKDACDDNNIICPIEKGNDYVYKLSIEVKPIYPTIATTVVFKLRDSRGKDFVCFRLPIKITD